MNFKQFAEVWERMKSMVKKLSYALINYLDGCQNFLCRFNFSSRNLLDSAAGGTFMSTTLGAATKLLEIGRASCRERV